MFFILFFNFISFVLDFQTFTLYYSKPSSLVDSIVLHTKHKVPSLYKYILTTPHFLSRAKPSVHLFVKDSVLIENPNLYLPSAPVCDRTSFPLLTFLSFPHQHANSTFFSPFFF